MARIVLKFGGTSVADIDRIIRVSHKVKAEHDRGHQVCVVVSAMAGATNKLIELCSGISPLFDSREYDTVVATGEQVTAGLTALALQKLGINARSWLGWQIPIRTDDVHAKARILSIEPERDRTAHGSRRGRRWCLVSKDCLIATGSPRLGRGAGDLSAVAMAAALKADRCDIYTDVDGVYTTDPRIVSKARKLTKITYEEMLELASQGAKVLQTRSVELAMNHRVRVQVLSSFG